MGTDRYRPDARAIGSLYRFDLTAWRMVYAEKLTLPAHTRPPFPPPITTTAAATTTTATLSPIPLKLRLNSFHGDVMRSTFERIRYKCAPQVVRDVFLRNFELCGMKSNTRERADGRERAREKAEAGGGRERERGGILVHERALNLVCEHRDCLARFSAHYTAWMYRQRR